MSKQAAWKAVKELRQSDSIQEIRQDLSSLFGCAVSSDAFKKLPPEVCGDIWDSYSKIAAFLNKLEEA